MATFGEEVDRLMKKCGLVQQSLADKLGVNQSFVSKIVRGERTGVGADVLYKLCDALGVPTDHFRPFLAPAVAEEPAAPIAPEPPAKKGGKGKK